MLALLAPALARGGERAGAAGAAEAPVWPDQVRAERMKLVRALGLGAPDTGYAVFQCPNCGKPLVASIRFPGATSPDSVRALRLRVERFFFAGHEAGRIRPADACTHCRGRVPADTMPRAILFGHVSSEAGGDLELLGEVEGNAFRRPRLARVPFEPGAAVTAADFPADAAAFRAGFGCDLALREVWRGLIEEAARTKRVAVHPVGRGYVLVASPTGGNDVERERARKEYPAALARARKEFGCTDALGLDLLAAGFPEGSPLRPDAWLGKERARLVTEGKVVAEALFSDEVLRERWRAECGRAGFTVAFEGEERSVVRVSKGGCEARARLEPVLLATLAGGDTFGEGLRRHGWLACAHADGQALLAERVRAKLGKVEVEVLGGRVLAVRDPKAAELRAPLADLAELAAPGGERALEDALAGVFGYDPATGRLRGASRSLVQCACGRPLWVGRRLRSAAWLERCGKGLLVEPFGEGEKAAAVYTLECGRHALFLAEENPWKLARAAAAGRFEADLKKQRHRLASVRGSREGAVLVLGRDVAAVLAEPRLARGLVAYLKAPAEWGRVHLWAPVTDAVVVSRAPVPGADRPHLAREIAREAGALGLAPSELDAEIEIERAGEAAGSFTRPREERGRPSPPGPRRAPRAR